MRSIGNVINKVKDWLSAVLAYAGAAINFVKDGYLAAVNWIAAHPHKTLLYGVSYVAANGLIFLLVL